jgi:hypothetical protein
VATSTGCAALGLVWQSIRSSYPSAWKERPVYVFLNSAHAELWVVSCLIILCGAVWLAGAWSRHTYVRMGSSMACMVIWFAFAENSFGADDQSTVPYFCIGAAFGCVIAACRT